MYTHSSATPSNNFRLSGTCGLYYRKDHMRSTGNGLPSVESICNTTCTMYTQQQKFTTTLVLQQMQISSLLVCNASSLAGDCIGCNTNYRLEHLSGCHAPRQSKNIAFSNILHPTYFCCWMYNRNTMEIEESGKLTHASWQESCCPEYSVVLTFQKIHSKHTDCPFC